jgi:hypothetical protein
MNDPKLDAGDWVGLGGLALAVIGSVVGGVKSMFGARDTRITNIENGHHEQVTQLAVLQTCQENTRQHLEHIRDSTRDTNDKLDLLLNTMANRVPGGQRSTDD